MEYIQYDRDGEKHTYSLSYAELREHYTRFCNMSDKEFLEKLPKAAHLACIICFLKEIPAYNIINDTGIIHELIHFIDGSSELPLEKLRELFKETLKLH